MTASPTPNVIPTKVGIHNALEKPASDFVVAEAPVANGPQECQFISHVPVRLIVDGKPVQRGNSLFNGNYITRVTIPFRGNEVEIGVRADGWTQSSAIFLKGCSPDIVHPLLKPDFGSEDCRGVYLEGRSHQIRSSGGGDVDVSPGDTLVAIFRGKTPREVDVTVTTNGSWTTPKASFARNADWPRIHFPIREVASQYTPSLPEEYKSRAEWYHCRGSLSRAKATAPVSGYTPLTPKFCQPKPGQLCKEVVWVFPDGPKKTTGMIPVVMDGQQYKNCLGVFDLFGRKIASCSIAGPAGKEGSEYNIHYERVRLPNGSFWSPSRSRGDYLLFANQ